MEVRTAGWNHELPTVVLPSAHRSIPLPLPERKP
jgi:hypothetical protein